MQSTPCMTVFRHAPRVLDAQASASLVNFASLVDRELWGLAAVAAQFKLPLQAAKLVSEIVFATEICQRARAPA